MNPYYFLANIIIALAPITVFLLRVVWEYEKKVLDE
jgi:hypothetical protein